MGRRLKLLLLSGLLVVGVIGVSLAQGQGPAGSTVTPADYLRWRNEFKNWGKWGPNDRKGTTNHITPQKIQNVAKLVRSGISVSLAHPVPQVAAADVNVNGLFRRSTNGISATGTTDNYQVNFHGTTVAHMDTWCHFFADGQMYNGIPVKGNITPGEGCKDGDVMIWKDGVTTRAVLYDIPQLKGVEWIDPMTPITRADLEAWEKKMGVRIGPGDIPLLYIGRWNRRAKMGAWAGQVAGYYADTIPWFREREPSFLAHDFNIDWNPRPGWGPEQGIPNQPIHQAALNWMGINILECLDLEAAVQTARKLKRYEFLITFAPLPVEGGTGSPVNPVAIF